MSASDFERFSQALSYDPDTGVFTWNFSPRIGIKAGRVAGSFQSDGYRLIKLHGKRHAAHRIALLLTEGVWPPNLVDHIDGDKANNRLSNLRHATGSENLQNQRRAHRNSTSGFLGVSIQRRDGKWLATIKAGAKRLRLGTFSTPEEASDCYQEAKRRLHSHCPPMYRDQGKPVPKVLR